MEQIGFVRNIIDGKLELEIKRVSGCGENCKGCGSSCDIPAHIITLPNKLNASIGDFVEIKGESKKLLKYAMIVYMVPFIYPVFKLCYITVPNISFYQNFSILKIQLPLNSYKINASRSFLLTSNFRL